MPSLIQITINQNDSGQRLDKFLFKMLNAPVSYIHKRIRVKDIKVNKKRSCYDYVLQCDDILSMYIDQDMIRQRRVEPTVAVGGLRVVYEDQNILVVSKPKGMLTIPDGRSKQPSLLDKVLAYLVKKGEYVPEKEHSFVPAVSTRLDYYTEGLVVACKNAAALREMNERIKNQQLERYYLCTVCGRVDFEYKEVSDCLKREDNKTTVCEDGKTALTIFRTLEVGEETSRLEAQIITGRTHQIRAHVSSLGYPLVGDVKYGAQACHTHKAWLIAYKLIFRFHSKGKLEYLNGLKIEN